MNVLIPVTISVREETARLLSEMSFDLGVSLDEMISALAEDSTIGLSTEMEFLNDVFIPDSCSTQDLIESLN